MSFIADKQTLDDLNVLGKYKSNSIYSIFNQVKTNGGERMLDEMFRCPLTDADQINRRSRLFKYFQENIPSFPFTPALVTAMEDFLSSSVFGNKITTAFEIFKRKLLYFIGIDEKYPDLVARLNASINLLKEFRDAVSSMNGIDDFDTQEMRAAKKLVLSDQFKFLTGNRITSIYEVIKCHILLSISFRKEIELVLQAVYQIDVCSSVASVAMKKNFVYADALLNGERNMYINGCRHPAIERAVANTVNLQQDGNVLFLTGANMAGKSTLMKSVGIAVYLAHMGFPVAAKEMKFSVMGGIFTSINVPDNLRLGYSHFYAEVRRVKAIAESVSSGKRLVVIFDELFKGTNVKDAYDATLAVIEAFSEYRGCFFIVSTHILEVAEDLKNRRDNFQFVYLPTIMEGNMPSYTYKLKSGITSDRQGMLIIENEAIIQTILGDF